MVVLPNPNYLGNVRTKLGGHAPQKAGMYRKGVGDGSEEGGGDGRLKHGIALDSIVGQEDGQGK